MACGWRSASVPGPPALPSSVGSRVSAGGCCPSCRAGAQGGLPRALPHKPDTWAIYTLLGAICNAERAGASPPPHLPCRRKLRPNTLLCTDGRGPPGELHGAVGTEPQAQTDAGRGLHLVKHGGGGPEWGEGWGGGFSSPRLLCGLLLQRCDASFLLRHRGLQPAHALRQLLQRPRAACIRAGLALSGLQDALVNLELAALG